ncbi:hypothetical protein E2C01_096367 [Portunus trituberculatus]|uniref:Uncharacterized protein n=1 Tax=Portunus trituberculatus TaxID=210409 RepID=A0A5B7JXS1_PORTR|nr:hypothetical protein [Portunus trituberculatus]
MRSRVIFLFGLEIKAAESGGSLPVWSKQKDCNLASCVCRSYRHIEAREGRGTLSRPGGAPETLARNPSAGRRRPGRRVPRIPWKIAKERDVSHVMLMALISLIPEMLRCQTVRSMKQTYS